MQTKTILAATASAANSSSFSVPNDAGAAAVVSTGYAGVEAATLQVYNHLTAQFVDLENSGVEYSLSADSNYINLSNMVGTFRYAKTATAAAVGITLMANFIPGV